MKRVAVLDYGSGNLRSAQRALERVGADVVVTSDADQALAADGLVVPGVGAFSACMDGIDKVGGAMIVRERLTAGRPVLGICVGMQVLFAAGRERGESRSGIGHWPGEVSKLSAPVLPHMGWNTVRAAEGSALFAGIDAQTRFYFVHSYAARSAPGLVSYAEHGERFVAAVEDGRCAATQFHPEKSGDAGAHVLENWLETLS